MTRERMANISATYGQPGGRMTLERQYLDCCWIPHEMAAAWCAARNVNTVPSVRRPSRQAIDDSEPLAYMRRLCAQGHSVRAAADQAASTLDLRGNSPDATVDRLRRKFAAERKQ